MKGHFFLLQLLVLAILATALAQKPMPGSKTKVVPKAKKQCICSRIGFIPPLCGSDGKNYGNPCEFDCALSSNPDLKRVNCRTRQPLESDSSEETFGRRVRNYKRVHQQERFKRRRHHHRDLSARKLVDISFSSSDSDDDEPEEVFRNKGVRGRAVIEFAPRADPKNSNRDETYKRRSNSAGRQDYNKQHQKRGQRLDYVDYDERPEDNFSVRKLGKKPPKTLPKGFGPSYRGSWRKLPGNYNDDGDESGSKSRRTYSKGGKDVYDYTVGVYGRSARGPPRITNLFKKAQAIDTARPRDTLDDEIQGRYSKKSKRKLLRLRRVDSDGIDSSDSSDSSDTSEELRPNHQQKHPAPKHKAQPHHDHPNRHHQHHAQAPHHGHKKSHPPSSVKPQHPSSGAQKNAPIPKPQNNPATGNKTSEAASRQNQQTERNNNNGSQNKTVAATSGRTTFLSGAPPPVSQSTKSTEALLPPGTSKPKESPRGHIVGDNGSLLSVQKSEGQAVAILPPPKSGPEDNNNKRLVLIVRK